MRQALTMGLVRPYVRAELPGWGRVYDRLVGDYRRDADWQDADPRIIRDKSYGLYRILDVREWSDRLFYFLGRWYDLETQFALARFLRPGATVLDVGANYGHFALAAAAEVGASGRVLAFEPNPDAMARLRMHVALNRLAQVVPQAIGLADHPGTLTLSIPRINPGEASFAAPDYDDAIRIDCPVETLDGLELPGRVDLVKIDVEGFELQVLRGGAALLERDRPVLITEVVDSHLQRAGTTKEELQAFLGDRGYKPHLLALGRAGRRPVLELRDGDGLVENGDYVWLPEPQGSGNADKTS